MNRATYDKGQGRKEQHGSPSYAACSSVSAVLSLLLPLQKVRLHWIHMEAESEKWDLGLSAAFHKNLAPWRGKQHFFMNSWPCLPEPVLYSLSPVRWEASNRNPVTLALIFMSLENKNDTSKEGSLGIEADSVSDLPGSQIISVFPWSKRWKLGLLFHK